MKKLLKSHGGFTLVELVVSFLLLTLLCVGAASVISASLGVYRSASARARGQMVAQTLLDKISGEISAAQPGKEKQYGVTVSSGSSGFAEGACIDLYSQGGSHSYITQEDGYLLIRYRGQSDWSFDEAVYNDFVIGELKFSILRGNVLNVRLRLTDTKSSYEYEAERCVQCSNYDRTCVDKIGYGDILPDQ